MIFLWLFRIKSVLGALLNFILEHWKAFIILAMVLTILSYKTAYEREKVAFEAYKTDIAQQAKEQQIKNDLLRKQAEQQVKNLTEIHAHNLEAIKHEYEKTHNTDVSTIDDLRQRLLSELREAYTVPPFTEDTANPQEWRERYTATFRQLETLKQACSLTTNDFNACRGWMDSACNQVGCE